MKISIGIPEFFEILPEFFQSEVLFLKTTTVDTLNFFYEKEVYKKVEAQIAKFLRKC